MPFVWRQCLSAHSVARERNPLGSATSDVSSRIKLTVAWLGLQVEPIFILGRSSGKEDNGLWNSRLRVLNRRASPSTTSTENEGGLSPPRSYSLLRRQNEQVHHPVSLSPRAHCLRLLRRHPFAFLGIQGELGEVLLDTAATPFSVSLQLHALRLVHLFGVLQVRQQSTNCNDPTRPC